MVLRAAICAHLEDTLFRAIRRVFHVRLVNFPQLQIRVSVYFVLPVSFQTTLEVQLVWIALLESLQHKEARCVQIVRKISFL
jgi:hypothetical protein